MGRGVDHPLPSAQRSKTPLPLLCLRGRLWGAIYPYNKHAPSNLRIYKTFIIFPYILVSTRNALLKVKTLSLFLKKHQNVEAHGGKEV